jgi:hypothetical protein
VPALTSALTDAIDVPVAAHAEVIGVVVPGECDHPPAAQGVMHREAPTPFKEQILRGGIHLAV